MSHEIDKKWLSETINMLMDKELPNVRYAGMVVKDGQLVGKGVNTVIRDNDPTAHAEVQAIRDAAKNIGRDLSGTTLYASAEPCPICLSAAAYTGVKRIVFALSAQQAADLGYDYGTSRRVMDALQQDFPYLEIEHISHPDAVKPFANGEG